MYILGSLRGRHTRAHGSHTDEPHNHPNPPAVGCPCAVFSLIGRRCTRARHAISLRGRETGRAVQWRSERSRCTPSTSATHGSWTGGMGLGFFSIQEKVNFNTRYHYISSYINVISLCIMIYHVQYHVYHVPRRHMIYQYIIFFLAGRHIMSYHVTFLMIYGHDTDT